MVSMHSHLGMTWVCRLSL